MAERVHQMGDPTTTIVIDPADVDNPILVNGLERWRGARRDGEWQREDNFSPQDPRTHADSLAVSEALPGMNDFRYSFVGRLVNAGRRGKWTKPAGNVCGPGCGIA